MIHAVWRVLGAPLAWWRRSLAFRVVEAACAVMNTMMISRRISRRRMASSMPFMPMKTMD